MIARMDQLTVVGRKSVARELLQSLQSLGVVQIDPLEPAEGLSLARLRLEGDDREDRDRWVAAVARAETLLTALDVADAAPGARGEVPQDIDGIEAYLKEVGPQVDKLVAERAAARDELELIRTYLPLFRLLAPTLAQVENSRYLTATAFLVAGDDLDEVRPGLEEALGDRLLLTTRPHGRETLVVAVTLARDEAALKAALSRAGLSPLGLPARYQALGTAKAVHTMEERSASLPKRLTAVGEELDKLGRQHGAKLQVLLASARNHQSRFERLENMLAGRYSFALRGWLPSDDTRKVVEALRKQFGEDVVVVTRPADEHHDVGVPVKLDNPGWVQPFQGLLALFAPPRYGNFDPSWTLAVFFPLFFGIVVGDMGFGLVFAAVGLWLRSRGRAGRALSLGPIGITLKAAALPAIGTVILWCAGWSIAWGFVYGEFFGNFLEHWPHDRPIFYVPGHGAEEALAHPEPGLAELDGAEAATADAAEVVEGEDDTHAAATDDHAAGWIPILLFRVEQYQPLLLLTLGFGILQVLGGWLIRVWYGVKHHDRKHTWEGIGMFSGLLAIVIFTWSFLNSGLDFGAVPTLVWWLVAALFAVFALSVVLSGVVLMIVELISNSGNILSYLRLFAVGLSAALVANLATGLGFALGEVAPVIGPILGILVALAVHAIAIALTIIGHTLQPLRLQYVEFFTKFGFYEESGRPYTPFKLYGGKA